MYQYQAISFNASNTLTTSIKLQKSGHEKSRLGEPNSRILTPPWNRKWSRVNLCIVELFGLIFEVEFVASVCVNSVSCIRSSQSIFMITMSLCLSDDVCSRILSTYRLPSS